MEVNFPESVDFVCCASDQSCKTFKYLLLSDPNVNAHTALHLLVVPCFLMSLPSPILEMAASVLHRRNKRAQQKPRQIPALWLQF